MQHDLLESRYVRYGIWDSVGASNNSVMVWVLFWVLRGDLSWKPQADAYPKADLSKQSVSDPLLQCKDLPQAHASSIWFDSFQTRSAKPKLSKISNDRHCRPSACPLNILVPRLSTILVLIPHLAAHVAAINLRYCQRCGTPHVTSKSRTLRGQLQQSEGRRRSHPRNPSCWSWVEYTN